MSAVQPVAVYALRIPPGDVLIPAVPEFSAMFRVTMAAIDPSEDAQTEDIDDKRPHRATLKVVRVADNSLDDDSEDDEDYLDGLDDDDDESSSDEETNGGPSTKKSRKQILLEALAADEDEDMDDDAEDDEEEDEDDERIDAAAEIKKIIAAAKGKGKALEDGSDEDDEDDDSEEGIELDECVLCTLDPDKNYQQPIDFVVNEGEKIFFKVSGTHTVHLTGNYVMPIDDGQASLYDDDDDDEYDLSPDEDELGLLADGLDDEDESDDLDDLADPRVTEIESDNDIKKAVAPKKGKNKRPAEESDDDDQGPDLDAIMAKSIKKDAVVTNGEPAKKLTKAEKKAAKKLKKNDGEAAAAIASSLPAGSKLETSTPSSDKKVQFAKDIIQGPTPSAPPALKKGDKKDDKKSNNSAAPAGSLGVRDVQGVLVDDRKLGSGPQAKKGSRLEMRYVGKLENGKVFDSNKSGPTFKVKVGVGEVIKGWDIGLQGISTGGERRLTIPAHLAYGNKALPGIPKNSKLIFDVKCISVK